VLAVGEQATRKGTKAVQEHTTPGAIALTYPHRGLHIIACHWPAPAELPQFCSCGDIACPTPACHPIGTLTASDATENLGQLGRWWLAHPNANPATITDDRVGVIELHHPAKPDALLYAMKEHRADQAPMVHGGQGVMSLLVKPNLGLDDAAVEVASHRISEIEKVVITPPGTLVPLPPSTQMTGGDVNLQWDLPVTATASVVRGRCQRSGRPPGRRLGGSSTSSPCAGVRTQPPGSGA
jgi:hypothetical protein